MIQIITEGCKIPIKMWLNNVEPTAIQQAKNLANLPFVFKHVALMPDCHQGYGMPIGGVLATQGVVVPNAVGVDIGCGMCALKTSLTGINIEEIKQVMSGIRELVPLGFDHHDKAQDENLMPSLENVPENGVVRRQYAAAKKQIGTLGGGNHFIEIQKGSDGHIWVMIHSGSRNIGLKVADHYNRIASQLNERWHSTVTKKMDLAFLPIETREAKDYFAEMQYCVDFAFANRKLMMNRIKEIMTDVTKCSFGMDEAGMNVDFDSSMINIAHNYAKMESHYNENVMVHRKGATLATEGTIGIIPGSQGTKSYIVRGKGNRESFTSCSHGAGRKMGRGQAVKNLNLETEIKKLDDQGIVHSIRTQKDLDEACGAYKDINEVMNSQKDLVEILVELTPLGVIKG